jgi:hypothetical protein
MGLGVLDDKSYPNIPGTVNIHDVVGAGMCGPVQIFIQILMPTSQAGRLGI